MASLKRVKTFHSGKTDRTLDYGKRVKLEFSEPSLPVGLFDDILDAIEY